MTLIIPKKELDKIKQHGEETYPYECCGVLIGIQDSSPKVLEARRMKNVNTELPEKRYSIDPLELYKVFQEADERGLQIIGVYHSHPDHPAKPSKFDLEHALPNWSYIVLSVEKGKAAAINSWRLSPDRSHFEKEELQIIE